MCPPKVVPKGKPVAIKKPEGESEEIKFAITKVSPVYIDAWQGEQDSCSICKNGFHQPCAECEVQDVTDACPIQEGFCGHKFHMHCISRWHKDHSTCPMCNSNWEVKN